MKYVVYYTEEFCKGILVDADSYEDATQRVLDAVDSGDIVLTADDYVNGSGDVDECHKAEDCEFGMYPTLESLTD